MEGRNIELREVTQNSYTASPNGVYFWAVDTKSDLDYIKHTWLF